MVFYEYQNSVQYNLRLCLKSHNQTGNISKTFLRPPVLKDDISLAESLTFQWKRPKTTCLERPHINYGQWGGLSRQVSLYLLRLFVISILLGWQTLLTVGKGGVWYSTHVVSDELWHGVTMVIMHQLVATQHHTSLHAFPLPSGITDGKLAPFLKCRKEILWTRTSPYIVLT